MTTDLKPERKDVQGKPEPASPATWTKEELHDNVTRQVESIVHDGDSRVPLGRLVMQLTHDSLFQDIVSRWNSLDGQRRVNAWRTIVRLAEKYRDEVVPICVRCGQCCQDGSPTLQIEDLDLLRENKLPWSQLITLRRGEPVNSPIQGKPFFLLDERIKIREKDGSRECVFYDSENNACRIYSDRPVQCRAQACWDMEAAEELAKQPYLTRGDLFGDVQLLLDLLKEYDERCGFAKLDRAIKELAESQEDKEEAVHRLIELLNYEEHFRSFVIDQLDIPDGISYVIFGRSYEELLPLFGFRVETEPGGTKVLTADAEK